MKAERGGKKERYVKHADTFFFLRGQSGLGIPEKEGGEELNLHPNRILTGQRGYRWSEEWE